MTKEKEFAIADDYGNVLSRGYSTRTEAKKALMEWNEEYSKEIEKYGITYRTFATQTCEFCSSGKLQSFTWFWGNYKSI